MLEFSRKNIRLLSFKSNRVNFALLDKTMVDIGSLYTVYRNRLGVQGSEVQGWRLIWIFTGRKPSQLPTPACKLSVSSTDMAPLCSARVREVIQGGQVQAGQCSVHWIVAILGCWPSTPRPIPRREAQSISSPANWVNEARNPELWTCERLRTTCWSVATRTASVPTFPKPNRFQH